MTDVQGGRTPLWLAATFFPLDVNAKLVSMLHSRQLDKLEYAAMYEEKCKETPLNVRIPTNNWNSAAKSQLCEVTQIRQTAGQNTL